MILTFSFSVSNGIYVSINKKTDRIHSANSTQGFLENLCSHLYVCAFISFGGTLCFGQVTVVSHFLHLLMMVFVVFRGTDALKNLLYSLIDVFKK